MHPYERPAAAAIVAILIAAICIWQLGVKEGLFWATLILLACGGVIVFH